MAQFDESLFDALFLGLLFRTGDRLAPDEKDPDTDDRDHPDQQHDPQQCCLPPIGCRRTGVVALATGLHTRLTDTIPIKTVDLSNNSG
ncbi:hypothetical protein ACFO5R_10265 [Halosolutus amylolyticus]|uniref:Uncharacterized protein n=1 Tax=Halosolutus amylolyticus TaxID=2932267 RepID=A0ABD5PP05_9EURY|nr:hypothetical protein [Halosolutus amylolyticus]